MFTKSQPRTAQLIRWVGLGLYGCVLMLTCAAAAQAVDVQPDVQVQLLAELRLPAAPARGWRWVPAKTIEEGQQVYYTLRIRQVGAPDRKPAVVQALPRNMHYVAGSASGAGADIDFSVDGGRTFAAPGALRLAGESRPAPPDSYTHIRWQLHYALAPQAVALARFRAVFR